MSPIGQDPVSTGIVANWARPGGNLTGVALPVPELDGKRVGLLHETIPAAHRIAILTTHGTPNDEIRTAVEAPQPRKGILLVRTEHMHVP